MPPGATITMTRERHWETKQKDPKVSVSLTSVPWVPLCLTLVLAPPPLQGRRVPDLKFREGEISCHREIPSSSLQVHVASPGRFPQNQDESAANLPLPGAGGAEQADGIPAPTPDTTGSAR